MRFGYHLHDGVMDKVHISEYQEHMKNGIYCPLGHPVIAKRGEVRVHHYSHRNGCNCDIVNGMSSWHSSSQDRAKKECQEVRLKDPTTHKYVHIADVLIPSSALENGMKMPSACKGYVIEYQHSPMEKSVMRKRESFYTGLGYHLVWVFDCSKWEYSTVCKSGECVTIARKQGPQFPLDGAYTGNVSKILDMGRKQMLLVEKQSGSIITGKAIDMVTFDKIYLGTMATDADSRPFHIPL
jgi:hypothetical protein